MDKTTHTCRDCSKPAARFDGNEYKPIYIDGLGWISDKPQCEHIEYSKERYYAQLVNRARAGLERIRMAGRETAVGETS